MKFSSVIKQMKQFSRGRSGDASWIFEDGKLRIEWSGMGMGLAAPGDRQAVLQVDANDMGQLVRIPMPATGQVVVKIDAHLEAVAHGKPTAPMEPKVLVVDEKGQVDLFGEDRGRR